MRRLTVVHVGSRRRENSDDPCSVRNRIPLTSVIETLGIDFTVSSFKDCFKRHKAVGDKLRQTWRRCCAEFKCTGALQLNYKQGGPPVISIKKLQDFLNRIIKFLRELLLQLMWPEKCVSGTYIAPTLVPSATLPDLSFESLGPPAQNDIINARHINSQNGNNAAAGTITAPWKTIGHAVQQLQPGQVAYVHPGTYHERIATSRNGLAATSNSPAKPIWLVGLISGQNRAVISDTTSGSTQPFIRLRHEYWVVEGLEVDCTGSAGGPAVTFSDAQHCIARNLHLHHGRAPNGVLFVGAKDVAIMDCYIHDFQRPGSDSHGILVFYNCERVMIWENRSENNVGDSVQCQGPGDDPNSPTPTNAVEPQHITIGYNDFSNDEENAVDLKSCRVVTVRGNKCHGYRPAQAGAGGSPKGDAIVVHVNAADVIIEQNEIWDCGRAATIGASNGQVGAVVFRWNLVRDMVDIPNVPETGAGIRIGPAARAEIYNNTFYNLPWQAVGAISPPSGYAVKLADNGKLPLSVFLNNIVMNAGLAFHITTSNISKLASGHNLIYQAAGMFQQPLVVDGQAISLQAWQTRGYDCGSSMGDPQFVNPAGHDFYTNMTSPARDSALPVQPPGPWIICGAAPDVGYIESCP